MTRRCRVTTAHRCTIGAHTDRPAPSLLPAVVALCGACAVFLASGAWR